MEKRDISDRVIKYYPQSFLIIPIYLKKDDDSFWKKEVKKVYKGKSLRWAKSELTAKDQAVFKDSSYFGYIQHFFCAFRGDTMPNENCVVLELKESDDFSKYDAQNESWIDTTYLYKSPYEANKDELFELTIQCHRHSIDTIRLLLNLSARTGLLTVPIRPSKIPLQIYQDFLKNIRFTSIECLKKKDGIDAPKTFNSIFESVMGDFNGHYSRANNDCVQHLSFLLIDEKNIGEEYSELLLDITRCRAQGEEKSNTTCKTLKLFDNLSIGASQEGTAVFSALKIKETKEEKQKQQKYYALEQRERIVIFFIIALQRYILLRVINDLTEEPSPDTLLYRFKNLLYSKSSRRLKKTRNELGIVCRTKVNNSFTSISNVPEANNYYRLCCNALEIDKLYHEIDGKVKLLDSYLTQQSDENKERADWHLSIILATLTVMSASNDGLQIIKWINDHADGDYKWLYYAGLILAIIFVAYLFITIFRARR